ncbi:MAG: Ig-like domain-containing protein [Sandaracinus sp.]|nr:Ig-like domain-containing protein [Myxococcales bacterium]MCB9611467.1 Ig-like domain-containing protein [Sandaracinus sp.]MCB9620572.1 Ig-like domain-containing protein [Sandaracinus sp.]MCB9623934.1 Ig-like domain-containing protein [Sandaracinus sp.]MCB9636571.1 Ig-like domain-containing protein [Sandaracinus sp.]
MAFERPPASLRRSLALLLALAACDGKDGVLYDDGGTDAPSVDGGTDGGFDAGDRVAPTVEEVVPDDEATDVARDADLVVRFSEPMRASGSVSVVPGGLELDGAWNSLGDTWTVNAPTEGWPESATLRASLEGFSDEAGNALAPYAWRFSTTADAPVVTTSSPADGATDTSARTAFVELTFSEPMDNTTGTLAATGLTFGVAEWLSGERVRFPVSGLAYESTYAVTLDGFQDRAGNALETSVYLEGSLDFTTGPDLDAPRVTDSSPDEGQLDVATDMLDEVVVVFDEAMDVAVGTATLEVDGRTTALSASWNAAGTEARFAVAGALRNGAAHRLVLTDFTDVAGNALDGTVYLLDGALDFRTGRDLVVPFVGYSDPIEGQPDFSFRRDTILIAFSEAMDTSDTTAILHDGAETVVLGGTWSLAGTRLTLDVAGLLVAGRSYRIDLTDFRDLGGTVVDTSHPYLGDGFLDFVMATPTGENCRDVLTAAEGTTVGAVTTWVIEDRQATLDDGSGTCGPDGDVRSADAVIRYTKTSAAVADGGRYLRVTARTLNTSRDVFVEVFRDVCDPTAAEALAARQHCVLENQSWDVHLDGGPGGYFLWIATDRNDAISPVEVTVEEIDAPRPGESCADPFDSSASFWSDMQTGLSDRPLGPAWYINIRNYVEEGDEERIDALDRADVMGGPGSIECDGTRYTHGADAVFDLVKTSATSVLDVRVSAISTHVFEVRDACDPSASSQLTCGTVGSGRWEQRTIEGAPGTYALWSAPDYLASSGQRELEGSYVVREVEPGPGDTCATGIPLVVGAPLAVPATGAQRLGQPSCFDGQLTQEKAVISGVSGPDDGITWYRFTASGAITGVRFGSIAGSSSDLDPSVALFDATSRTELTCAADEPENGLTVFGNAGREYCVAVLNTPRLETIELVSFPTYDGVGSTVTDLNVSRPFNDSGTEVSITSDQWLGVTPTTLYMQLGTSGTSAGLLRVSKAGGTRAELLRDGIESVLGYGGAITTGENVFLVDNNTTTASRTYRAVRAGLVELTEWDAAGGYPNHAFYDVAFDGTTLLTATYVSSTSGTPPTRFYTLDPTAAGPGTEIGSTTELYRVRAIGTDGTWVFVVANPYGDTSTEGVYRLPLTNLAATPEPLWLGNLPTSATALEVQVTASTTYVYFRDQDGNVHVADAGGASAQYLGVLSALGRSGDVAMGFDPVGPSLYLFESETESTGRIVRLR